MPITPATVFPVLPLSLWRGLAFASPPGFTPPSLLDGGALTLLASGSRTGKTQRGPALHSSSTSNGGGSYPFPVALSAITDQMTVIVIGQLDASGDDTSNALLLSIPYSSSWSNPYATMLFRKNSNATAGRLEYADSASTFTGTDSDTGFVSLGEGTHTYAFTRASTALLFYKDGKQFGAAKTTGSASFQPVNTQPITLLNRSSTDTGEGTIGDVAFAGIWTRALTPAEMALIHRTFNTLALNVPRWIAIQGAAPAATGFMTLNTGYWGTP